MSIFGNFQIHVYTLSLYDWHMDCSLWKTRYVVLDGNDNRILRSVEEDIPGLMSEFDYEYSRNDLRLSCVCEEDKNQVPVLEDGDSLLLGFPEEESLPIHHGILETLQARMDWLQSGKLQHFTKITKEATPLYGSG